MAIQTTFTREMEIASAGLVQDPLNADIESRALDSAAGCDAGIIVTAGASWERCKLIADAADLLLIVGAVCARSIKMPISSTTRFAQRETLAVLTRGNIWLQCHGTVTDDMRDVYVVHESAGGNLGKIRADAGSGDNEATLVPGIKVRKGAVAGKFALCQLMLGPQGPIGPEGPAGP